MPLLPQLVHIYFRGVGATVYSTIPKDSIPADVLRELLDVRLVEYRDRFVDLTAAGVAARDADPSTAVQSALRR